MGVMNRLPFSSNLLPAVFALVAVVGCGPAEDPAQNAFDLAPVFDSAIRLEADGALVPPNRIELVGDTLFVTARGMPDVFLFSASSFAHLGTVRLVADVPVLPSDFAVTADAFLVGDHAQGLIAVFDRSGNLRDGFGLHPDGSTRITPWAVAEYGGVLYVADCSTGRVLAVSLVDAPGITEFGELILSVPAPDRDPLSSPCSVFVTPDGRLLVGDAREGTVRVYTCDGRLVYRLDGLPGRRLWLPRGLAMDDLPDPGLQDEESFDPSGVREQGRIHVVDGQNGRIHMFNSLGRYVASYPDDKETLSGPSDIAIDRTRKRVILCDPPAQRLVVFSYEECSSTDSRGRGSPDSGGRPDDTE